MLCDLSDHLPCGIDLSAYPTGYKLDRDEPTSLGIVDPGDIIHAACDNENTIGRPGQVVDLGTGRATHVLHTPCFLVIRTVFAQPRLRLQLRRYPQQDISI